MLWNESSVSARVGRIVNPVMTLPIEKRINVEMFIGGTRALLKDWYQFKQGVTERRHFSDMILGCRLE